MVWLLFAKITFNLGHITSHHCKPPNTYYIIARRREHIWLRDNNKNYTQPANHFYISRGWFLFPEHASIVGCGVLSICSKQYVELSEAFAHAWRLYVLDYCVRTRAARFGEASLWQENVCYSAVIGIWLFGILRQLHIITIGLANLSIWCTHASTSILVIDASRIGCDHSKFHRLTHTHTQSYTLFIKIQVTSSWSAYLSAELAQDCASQS